MIEKYGRSLGNKYIKHIFTYLVVLCAWVIFNADSMTHALQYYASMLHINKNNWVDRYGLYWVGQYKFFLAVGFILAFPISNILYKFLNSRCPVKALSIVQIVGMCVLLFMDISYAVGGGYNPFIYFNF